MTTEIAVLNRLGVALATDSAVTISGASRTKIFNSADKLFELSCDHPVAIMINGNMDFFGVPWEILVKDFREAKGKTPLNAIEDWANAFLAFSQVHSHLTLLADDEYINNIAQSEIGIIRGELLDQFWNARTEFSLSEAKTLIQQIASIRTAELLKMGVSAAHRELNVTEVAARYASVLREIIIDELKPVTVDDDDINTVTKQTATAIITVIRDASTTGLIFAGYSMNQSFPCIYSVDVSGVLYGKKAYRNQRTSAGRHGQKRIHCVVCPDRRDRPTPRRR